MHEGMGKLGVHAGSKLSFASVLISASLALEHAVSRTQPLPRDTTKVCHSDRCSSLSPGLAKAKLGMNC